VQITRYFEETTRKHGKNMASQYNVFLLQHTGLFRQNMIR